MTRLFTLTWLTLVTGLFGACAHPGAAPKGPYVAAEVRRAAIQRAQVWTQTDVPSMDLRVGPKGAGAFPPDASIDCNYLEKKMSGATPKFTCVIPPDDQLKVKYGRHNGEVYAEVAAARLFWALGFGAERMYPVSVNCSGCPAAIAADTKIASVERKMKGTDLDTEHVVGWAWPELDQVDPHAGGASLAQRDALKLLATFVQHTDSKAEQQRLICLPSGDEAASKSKEKKAAKGEKAQASVDDCAEPFMMVHDLGQTFGHANRLNRSDVGSVNLNEWKKAPVWEDPERCIAYLPKSMSGSLDNPRISEAGRQFLANLLAELTDTQIHDLFDVSRFPQRWDAKQSPDHAATVEQWVDTFKKKRDEIVNHRCTAGE